MSSYKIILASIFSLFLVSSAQSFTYKRSDAQYGAPDASEATFTQTGSGAVATTIAAKLKNTWVSVTDFGADPTGVSDSTSAISLAYNRVAAMGGGTLFFPPGTYLASVLPTIAQNGVIVQCSGGALGGGTRLAQTSITGDFLTVTGGHVWINDCQFRPTVRKTSGFQIVFSNTYLSGVNRVRIEYAYSGIESISSTEVHLNEVTLRYLLGIYGLYYSGTPGAQSYGATLNNFVADNPPPLPITAAKAWATGTAYTVGDMVYVNSNVYQCSVSGTSAGAGTGPSGLPGGTTPDSAFTNTITDNTVQWKFVYNTLTWIVWDNYAYSLRGNNVILIDGYQGFATVDTANTGSSQPKYGMFNDIEVDHPFAAGIYFQNGFQMAIANSFVGSALSNNGITIASTYKGSTAITNSRIAGNAQYGIAVLGGVDLLISNNWITSNSSSGSGAYHGIGISPNVNNFVISGNKLGADADIGTSFQAYGVNVNAGTSNYYTITNNICSGQNVTGCVVDSGTGLNKTVTGNN